MERPVKCIYNQKQLEKRVRYWQAKLRLQDWMVDVSLRQASEMIEHAEGQCNWHKDAKQAHIYILDPTEFPKASWHPQDMEWTIIHELLHLHFIEFNPSNKPSLTTAVEQAIEGLTHGYIEQERKLRKKK